MAEEKSWQQPNVKHGLDSQTELTDLTWQNYS